MTLFIELTTDNNSKVMINVNAIERYKELITDTGIRFTVIYFLGGYETVKESYESIKRLMNKQG